MFSIEICHSDHTTFLTYLQENLKDHHISQFKIHIDNDNKSEILPSYGTYDWTHDGDTFKITYREEGKPISCSHSPCYFKRIRVEHENLERLQRFVTLSLTDSKPIDKQKIKLYVGKVRGYWEMFQSIYAQPMDMIFLDSTLKTSIINHIDTFFDSKAKHIKYGRPYKLNFLFTGVPGSGKSSLIKALALKYNRPLYIMGFSKSLTDETFVDLITEVKDNSILLLEDIDSFFMDRKAIDINVSFSCLINVLDGTLNKGNGVITIMTANNPERLDPALIRPGRVDRIIKFDFPKRMDIEIAFKELTDGATDFDVFHKLVKNTKISMSGIVDYLFRHPKDYIQCIDELLDSTQLLHDIINDKTEKIYL